METKVILNMEHNNNFKRTNFLEFINAFCNTQHTQLNSYLIDSTNKRIRNKNR